MGKSDGLEIPLLPGVEKKGGGGVGQKTWRFEQGSNTEIACAYSSVLHTLQVVAAV